MEVVKKPTSKEKGLAARVYSLTDKGREFMNGLDNEVEATTVEKIAHINFRTLSGEMYGKKMSEDDVVDFMDYLGKAFELAIEIAKKEGRDFPTIEDAKKAAEQIRNDKFSKDL